MIPNENTSAVSEYLSADSTSGAIHCTYSKKNKYEGEMEQWL